MHNYNNLLTNRRVLHPATRDCKNRLRKWLKILFYVNGNLVLVSKDIQKFNLKNLNDVAEKQECVPYNISLGGGSIGLMEAIYPNYYDIPKYILPIENYFCGSFIGDIKSFKMYNGNIDYSIVKDYLS